MSLAVRILNLAVALVFTLTSTAYAVPQNLWETRTSDGTSAAKGSVAHGFVDPAKFLVPENFGTVTERFTSSGTSNSRKVIIQIQDSHCNYESQMNISKMIGLMGSDKESAAAVGLIAVEGAQGAVDATPLRAYPDAGIREEVSDYLMRTGWLTGTEFYAVNATQEPMPLWGIENKPLYNENLKYFREAKAQGDRSKLFFEKLTSAIDVLKLKVFSKGLAAVVKMQDDWDKNVIKFTDYCASLTDLAMKHGIGLGGKPYFCDPAAYPNLTMAVESMQIEKKLNSKLIDVERKEMLAALQKAMVKEELSELVKQSLFLRIGKITSPMFYAYLADTAAAKKFDLSKYPNLSLYMQMVAIHDKVQAGVLFDEVDSLDTAVKKKMYTNRDEQELDELIDQGKALQNLLDLRMTRKDLAFYDNNSKDVSPGSIVKRVAKISEKKGLNDALAGSLAWLDQNKELDVSACRNFYVAALERDKAMVEKTIGEMEKRKSTAVAMVAGGFHTQGMKELFKAKGYSYVVVTPRMTQKYDDKVYLARMMNEVSEYDKLFGSTGSRLAPEPVLAVTGSERDAIIGAFYAEAQSLRMLKEGKDLTIGDMPEGGKIIARRTSEKSTVIVEMRDANNKTTKTISVVIRTGADKKPSFDMQIISAVAQVGTTQEAASPVVRTGPKEKVELTPEEKRESRSFKTYSADAFLTDIRTRVVKFVLESVNRMTVGYHNFLHFNELLNFFDQSVAAGKLKFQNQKRGVQLTRAAIMLHDLGYFTESDQPQLKGKLADDHESRSKEEAEKILKELGVSPEEIAAVKFMIDKTVLSEYVKDQNGNLVLDAAGNPKKNFKAFKLLQDEVALEDAIYAALQAGKPLTGAQQAYLVQQFPNVDLGIKSNQQMIMDAIVGGRMMGIADVYGQDPTYLYLVALLQSEFAQDGNIAGKLTRFEQVADSAGFAAFIGGARLSHFLNSETVPLKDVVPETVSNARSANIARMGEVGRAIRVLKGLEAETQALGKTQAAAYLRAFITEGVEKNIFDDKLVADLNAEIKEYEAESSHRDQLVAIAKESGITENSLLDFVRVKLASYLGFGARDRFQPQAATALASVPNAGEVAQAEVNDVAAFIDVLNKMEKEKAAAAINSLIAFDILSMLEQAAKQANPQMKQKLYDEILSVSRALVKSYAERGEIQQMENFITALSARTADMTAEGGALKDFISNLRITINMSNELTNRIRGEPIDSVITLAQQSSGRYTRFENSGDDLQKLVMKLFVTQRLKENQGEYASGRYEGGDFQKLREGFKELHPDLKLGFMALIKDSAEQRAEEEAEEAQTLKRLAEVSEDFRIRGEEADKPAAELIAKAIEERTDGELKTLQEDIEKMLDTVMVTPKMRISLEGKLDAVKKARGKLAHTRLVEISKMDFDWLTDAQKLILVKELEEIMAADKSKAITMPADEAKVSIAYLLAKLMPRKAIIAKALPQFELKAPEILAGKVLTNVTDEKTLFQKLTDLFSQMWSAVLMTLGYSKDVADDQAGKITAGYDMELEGKMTDDVFTAQIQGKDSAFSATLQKKGNNVTIKKFSPDLKYNSIETLVSHVLTGKTMMMNLAANELVRRATSKALGNQHYNAIRAVTDLMKNKQLPKEIQTLFINGLARIDILADRRIRADDHEAVRQDFREAFDRLTLRLAAMKTPGTGAATERWDGFESELESLVSALQGGYDAYASPQSVAITADKAVITLANNVKITITSGPTADGDRAQLNPDGSITMNAEDYGRLKQQYEKGDASVKSEIARALGELAFHEIGEGRLIGQVLDRSDLTQEQRHALQSALDSRLAGTTVTKVMRYLNIPGMSLDQLAGIAYEHPNDPNHEMYFAAQQELAQRGDAEAAEAFLEKSGGYLRDVLSNSDLNAADKGRLLETIGRIREFAGYARLAEALQKTINLEAVTDIEKDAKSFARDINGKINLMLIDAALGNGDLSALNAYILDLGWQMPADVKAKSAADIIAAIVKNPTGVLAFMGGKNTAEAKTAKAQAKKDLDTALKEYFAQYGASYDTNARAVNEVLRRLEEARQKGSKEFVDTSVFKNMTDPAQLLQLSTVLDAFAREGVNVVIADAADEPFAENIKNTDAYKKFAQKMNMLKLNKNVAFVQNKRDALAAAVKTKLTEKGWVDGTGKIIGEFGFMVSAEHLGDYTALIEGLGQLASLLVSDAGGNIRPVDIALLKDIGLGAVAEQIKTGDIKLIEIMDIGAGTFDEMKASSETLIHA
jgi:hypothetical protein